MILIIENNSKPTIVQGRKSMKVSFNDESMIVLEYDYRVDFKAK